MGIFDNISSSISSGFNSLSNAFSSVLSTVSAIGSRIAEFAHNIKPFLGPILTTIAHVVPHPAVKAVVTCANALLHALSIFHSDENVEGMGDRALQASAQGITSDNFEKFDDYINALRNFELDPEASKKFNPAEKLVAGLGIATAAVEEKFKAELGSLKDIWLLPITNSDYFTPDRLKALLESGKMIGDVSAYLEKSMSGEESSAFRKNMEITPEGKTMNEIEKGQLQDALNTARNEWATLEQKLKSED